MGYKETLEVNNTHPVTQWIMGTRAHDLYGLDCDDFIDKFKVIPDHIRDQNQYRQSFIDQIVAATDIEIDHDDDLDTQFEDALEIFYDYIDDDYGSLTQDLKGISVAKLTMKDLHHGFLSVLGADALDNDQLWQIYKKLPTIARRTFFNSTKYNEGNLLKFRNTKNVKNLIRYLRDNDKIKIQLTSHQIKTIIKKMELGDLINLDKLTSTTRTKATDFWTTMSITTYRWSGTVAETATLARYLPFLTTVNNYLVAPVVIGISLLVAVHHHQKFLIKEASRNKKFLRRCIAKNNKKQELGHLKDEINKLDDFNGINAYRLIRRWLRSAGLTDDFKYSLREAKKAFSPRQKLNVLKTAIGNKRDLLIDRDEETEKQKLYKLHLLEFITATVPEDDFSEEDDETEEEVVKKKLMIFNREIPWFMQLIWDYSIEFLTPFWMFAKELLGPTFELIRETTAPYFFPVLYGVVTALGIIALTCAYTLAPEILIPIALIAIVVGAFTGIARYLRDRQNEMRDSIKDGAKNKKHHVTHQIEDLLQHKEACEVIHEIRNEAVFNPPALEISDNVNDESVEIELHIRKGDNVQVVMLNESALQGLKRNTAFNDFAKNAEQFEDESTIMESSVAAA